MRQRNEADQGRPSEHDQGQAAGEDRLAVELGQLARELQQQPAEVLLENIVRAAVELIPGVEDASITLVQGRRTVTSHAPSSELPRLVDKIQMEEGQGPCLQSAYDQQTVRVPDLRTEQRWPAFARRAVAETGIRAMLSLQLFVQEDNLGAMNLYSRKPDVFTDESEHVGLLVASHAAVALAQSRQGTQLTEAIASRDTIGQAKGIIMERYKVSAEQAFYLLTYASSRTNRKLFDIADQLATTGELPLG